MRALLLVVLLAAVSTVTAEPLPTQSRHLNIYWMPDGYQIGIDNDPLWDLEFNSNDSPRKLTVTTPALYYPPAVFELQRHYLEAPKSESGFRKFAFQVIKESLAQAKYDGDFTLANLQPQIYEHLTGYEFSFTLTPDLDHTIFVGRYQGQAIFTANVSTGKHKLKHIQPAVTRLLSSVKVLDPAATQADAN